MYTGLLHLHSFLRYVVLILLVISAFKSLVGMIKSSSFTKADDKSSLFVMIGTHLQLVIGLLLYFISPKVQFGNMGEVMKNDVLRFWTVEHISMMLIAVILITLGRSLSKKASTDVKKHRRVAIYFLIALLIIFFSIPWPFLKPELSAGWF